MCQQKKVTSSLNKPDKVYSEAIAQQNILNGYQRRINTAKEGFFFFFFFTTSGNMIVVVLPLYSITVHFKSHNRSFQF